MSTQELTAPCGPERFLNISNIEEQQVHHGKKFDDVDICYIFSGHAFSEKTGKELSKEPDELV